MKATNCCICNESLTGGDDTFGISGYPMCKKHWDDRESWDVYEIPAPLSGKVDFEQMFIDRMAEIYRRYTLSGDAETILAGIGSVASRTLMAYDVHLGRCARGLPEVEDLLDKYRVDSLVTKQEVA